MLFCLIALTFVTLVCLTVCKDSFLNREFRIYQKVIKYPFLKREFIKSTYETFE